jgi:hypothetical protein
MTLYIHYMSTEITSQSIRRQFRFRTMTNGRPYAETLNQQTGTWHRFSFEIAKDLVKRGFADDAHRLPLCSFCKQPQSAPDCERREHWGV